MAHHFRSLALALVAGALLTSAAAPRLARSQSQNATVKVDGPTSVTASAKDVQVNIDVANASDLAGFEFVLTVDPKILHPVSVAKTAFLGQTGREIYCGDPTVESAAVRYTCVTLRMNPAGVNGSGTLAVVTLKPMGKGTSPLQLSHVNLAHRDGSALPSQTVDAKLTVTGTGGWLTWWAATLIAVAAAVVVVLAAALIWRRRRGRAVPGTQTVDDGGSVI